VRLVPVLLLLLLGGCDISMTQQNRYRVEATAADGGSSARMLPDHVVAQGDLTRGDAAKTPPPADAAFLKRGHDRFSIYCSPCHGLDGRGDGAVVKRGFPQPPSYLSKRLMGAPASHFYEVITRGFGRMYSYADRVTPRDRWAIIAYIRALQLSQQASLAPKETAQ
jgi:mono/diheme cytochrome c family protein